MRTPRPNKTDSSPVVNTAANCPEGDRSPSGPPPGAALMVMSSEATLDAYVNDPRRLAVAAERDAAIARTDLFRIQPVSWPAPGCSWH